MPFEKIDGQIIILIVFVVISAINWLIQKIKGPAGGEHEGSESIEDLYEEFRDEIRQRQTGTRQTEPQAPPQQSIPGPPPLPQVKVIPPDAGFRPVTQPTPAPRPKKASLSSEQKAAAARFQERFTTKRRTTPQNYVRNLLSSPQSARQAIILAEILGKPKSLRDA